MVWYKYERTAEFKKLQKFPRNIMVSQKNRKGKFAVKLIRFCKFFSSDRWKMLYIAGHILYCITYSPPNPKNSYFVRKS